MKKIVLTTFGVLACATVVWAGGKNLQHFPKDTSNEDLKKEMNVIKRSLGTDCAHCHQMKPERDFSVDTDDKKTARAMLDMTTKLNAECMTPQYLGMRRAPKASCYMCHKGNVKVETEPKNPDDEKRFNDMVASGRKKKTIDAMKKLTDELNKTYFTWKDAPKATCWMCHRGRGEFRAQLPRERAEDSDAEGEGEGEHHDEKKADEKKSDDKKPDEKKTEGDKKPDQKEPD